MPNHEKASVALLLVVCLVLGLATAVSPNAGLVVGWFIAMYVVIRLFFVDHPVVWWYDALFFGVAVGIALLRSRCVRSGLRGVAFDRDHDTELSSLQR